MTKPNMNPKRNVMPTQEASVRAHNFDEVALGYDESTAVNEAMRCLNCKTMPCVDGCPVRIHIPEFISKVKEGDFNQIAKLYEAHNIPISERSKQLQGGTYFTLGPSLVYDTRDNVMSPRNGVLATLRFNENINITDFDYTYGSLTAGIKRYFPIMKKSSFSLLARAGGKIHGDMPEVMAFRLGGPYTVRGYRMSTIGTGDGFMMASAELTTPFFFLDRIEKAQFLDNIKFSMFLDAGHLFNGTVTNKIYNRPEYGIAGGVGVHLIYFIILIIPVWQSRE